MRIWPLTLAVTLVTTQAMADPAAKYFQPAYAAEKAQNYPEAMRWFLAIEKEDRDTNDLSMAEFHLGLYFERGNGVTPNYGTAAEWYQKAISHSGMAGENGAKQRLGTLYAFGLGVPKDREKARAMFESIADLSSRKLYITLLDTNKLPSNPDEISAELVRQVYADKAQREIAERDQVQAREQEQEQAQEEQATEVEAEGVHVRCALIKGHGGCPAIVTMILDLPSRRIYVDPILGYAQGNDKLIVDGKHKVWAGQDFIERVIVNSDSVRFGLSPFIGNLNLNTGDYDDGQGCLSQCEVVKGAAIPH